MTEEQALLLRHSAFVIRLPAVVARLRDEGRWLSGLGEILFELSAIQ